MRVSASGWSQVLQQVAQVIEQIPDRRLQSNLTASAAILAGLVLEAEVMRALATEGHHAGVRYLSGDSGRDDSREYAAGGA